MKYLYKLVESIISKLGEKLMDCVLKETHEDTLVSLQNNMRKLSAKAFDVEEEIKKAEPLGNRKRKREVKEWLEHVQTAENMFLEVENKIQMEGFIRRFFGGGYATQLNGRICELVEQSQYFRELVFACETKGQTLLTSNLVGREFERNLRRILKFLVENNGLCIGICGMGGVGKTILAKHVNNILQEFGYCVSWITVSQEFGIMSLQDKIAKDIALDLSGENDKHKRASMLHGVLSKTKNRLLIFDDMWEVIDLKDVGIPLCLDGCKLMLTTRLLELCHQMQCTQVIEVKTLDKEEGWNLFNETLGQQEMELTPAVHEIAKVMVELCNGLPLGIITIASRMRGETCRNVWSDALEELKESFMEREEKVFKVLKYSFDQLGGRNGKHSGYSKLQLCFLHCSLYPKDYLINRNELIIQFISQEFLEKRKSRKELIVQGRAVLEKLVKAFLLERSHARLKMHGLVRAMALKIMEGDTEVISDHYSLKEIQSTVSPGCSMLSTLLLRESSLVPIRSYSFFERHPLCILDFSTTNIQEFPDSFRALILQYIIPNMGKILELDISGTIILEVSQALQAARNLQMLPRDFLLKLPYLQCLHITCDVHILVEEIEKLNHLAELRGRVRDGSEFNSLVRRRPSCLYNIVVGSDGSLYEFVVSGGPREYMLSKYRSKKRKERSLIWLTQGNQCLQLNPSVGRSNHVVENFASVYTERPDGTKCEEMECSWRREQLLAANAVASTSTSVFPVPPLSIFITIRRKNSGIHSNTTAVL